MRILIDIGHAAHVHLFRNFIQRLKDLGHEVTVVSRDKPYVLELLEYFQIENVCLSASRKGLWGLFIEWAVRTFRILKLHRQKKFDLAIGTSVSIPYLTLLFGVRSVNVQEDDDSVVPLHVMLAYPFSSVIMNPYFLKFRFFRNKRHLHSSLHEMAYLSSDEFVPDCSVVRKYSLEPFSYIILRKVSLTAHHDIGARGLNERHVELVRRAFPYLPIISSDELKKGDVEVHDMHHVLAHARLVVTDSQTMTAEAACLGVSVVRVSTFVGKLSYLDDLERVGLAHSCLPDDLERLELLLSDISKENRVSKKSEERRLFALRRYGNFNLDLLDIVGEQ